MLIFQSMSPFEDGNKITSCYLALHQLRTGGYGIRGLYSFERCFEAYLRTSEGLPMEGDYTLHLEHFLEHVSGAYELTASIVSSHMGEWVQSSPEALRRLDSEQRILFHQLALKRSSMSIAEVRDLLSLSDRSTRDRISLWRVQGFIELTDASAIRTRSIKLTLEYESLAALIRTDSSNYPVAQLLSTSSVERAEAASIAESGHVQRVTWYGQLDRIRDYDKKNLMCKCGNEDNWEQSFHGDLDCTVCGWHCNVDRQAVYNDFRGRIRKELSSQQ